MRYARSRLFLEEAGDTGAAFLGAGFAMAGFSAAESLDSSSKLGQIVARPQWAQSGFWE